MQHCPSCDTEQPENNKFCLECGTALNVSCAATIPHAAPASAAGSDLQSSLSDSSHHGRFLPGTKIADRYRIVSLVGKGGMGEVYRADDLKLGHTVALKFLPKDLAEDAQRLSYFHSEVRLTRQISHPNVCRVYDIGEIEGQHFLSMEYIDGEDLKVLLRRIGRLPPDKGVQIAQQLCAGLAAAHEQGVLHRDLKPANVMIDGRGRVRITDFGLARFIGDTYEEEIAGTPAYMAPEQLSRGETTVQSDLYSLGLILHEAFTGKPVHPIGSVAERLKQLSDSSRSAVIDGDSLDKSIGSTIAWCLESSPQDRPRTAQAVAAALPGGDPLNAALAAGQTPSPEMVAAAGPQNTLAPRLAAALLASVFACLLVDCWFADRLTSVNQGRLEYAPFVLEIKAQELLRDQLGYSEPPHDWIFGYHYHAEREIRFWYRQRQDASFATYSTWNEFGKYSRSRSTYRTPPWDHPNELGLELSPNGKLLYFRATPSSKPGAVSKSSQEGAFDWSRWFSPALTGYQLGGNAAAEATGGSPAGNEPSPLEKLSGPIRTPPDAFDAVQVWRGVDPDTQQEFYVQAAAYRGRPTYFETFTAEQFEQERTAGHWSGRINEPDDQVAQFFRGVINILFLCAAGLAWLNSRSGRADHAGAARLALFIFITGVVIWLTFTRRLWISEPIVPMLAQALVLTALVWATYLALEPFARRIWPDMLISWTRLLSGRLSDPMIGRDILVGAVVGSAIPAVGYLAVELARWVSGVMPPLSQVQNMALAGPRELVGTALEIHLGGVLAMSLLLMMLVGLRFLLRSQRWAIGIFGAILFAVAIRLTGPLTVAPDRIVLWLFIAGAIFAWVTTLVRFGFLAFISTAITYLMITGFPLTTDGSKWYFGHGIFAITWLSLLALYACYIAVGGRKFFATAQA